jgi:hypothetical protein
MGEGGGLCYGFFLKNILMLNFQEKNIFARKRQGKNILMQDFHADCNVTVKPLFGQ